VAFVIVKKLLLLGMLLLGMWLRYSMSKLYAKQNVSVIIVASIFAIGMSASINENAKAQMSNSSMIGGASQNQTNMMMTGANITGSIPLGSTIAKAIASQIHVSLANASTTAEKAVGVSAHSIAVRIGVVHGFLVYMALVHDMNSGTFHGVLVDPGNGKVLASTPISFAALGTMMGGGMMGMMMGPGMSGYGMGMMQHGMGMMQHGMLKAPGMMLGHP
jgi:hypothetical protein